MSSSGSASSVRMSSSPTSIIQSTVSRPRYRRGARVALLIDQ